MASASTAVIGSGARGASIGKTSSYDLLKALDELLADPSFALPSPLASDARKTAFDLKQWCQKSENRSKCDQFSSKLVGELSKCFPRSAGTTRKKREKMWTTFHKIRTSKEFTTRWTNFLKEEVGVSACPIFFQHVTTSIFGDKVREKFPVTAEQAKQSEEPPLSYEEMNALRYAAGYVPRHLKKRLTKSAHPMKDELTLCLLDLLQDEKEDNIFDSSDWINIVDRGGLKHVNNATYHVFLGMELEIRRHLSIESVRKINAGFKTKVTESILNNEDVQFHWTVVSADWEEKESAALLELVVDLFMTIRGFAFVSSWMELRKQETKKSTQKSKGVRKRLLATSDSQ